MNREERRSAGNAAQRCPECGETLKAKNLEAHFARAHPGRSPGDDTGGARAPLSEREQSRSEVGGPIEPGAAPDAAQRPEQAPIPGAAERRPSTQDKNAGS